MPITRAAQTAGTVQARCMGGKAAVEDNANNISDPLTKLSVPLFG